MYNTEVRPNFTGKHLHIPKHTDTQTRKNDYNDMHSSQLREITIRRESNESTQGIRMAHRRMLLRHDDHGDYEKIKVPCRKSRGQRNCWRDPGDGEELSPGFFASMWSVPTRGAS